MRRYDDDLDFDESLREKTDWKKYIGIGVAVAALLLLVIMSVAKNPREESVAVDTAGTADTESVSSE